MQCTCTNFGLCSFLSMVLNSCLSLLLCLLYPDRTAGFIILCSSYQFTDGKRMIYFCHVFASIDCRCALYAWIQQNRVPDCCILSTETRLEVLCVYYQHVTLISVIFKLYCYLFMSPLRQHLFVCFMAKSAFWRGFSALAPYTGVGPI